MTDRSPTLWASADLTPISPAPLHPSSPVMVPTLQDQADTLSTMSQPGMDQTGDQASIALASVDGRAMFSNRNQVPIMNGHGDIIDRTINSSHPAINNSPGDGETRTQEGNAISVRSEGDLQNSGSATEEPSVSHQSVSRVYDSAVNTDVSDTLTNRSEPAAPSHDFAYDPSLNNAQAFSPTLQAPNLSPNAKESSHADQPQGQARSIFINDTKPPSRQPTEATNKTGGLSANNTSETNDHIDIQALVDTITANAAKEDDGHGAVLKDTGATPGISSSSLPPRPPIPQQSAQSYIPSEDTRVYQPGFVPSIPITLPPSLPLAPGTSYPMGAPGTIPDSHGALPPPPSASLNAPPMPQFTHTPIHPTVMGGQSPALTPTQQWESFLQDERRYVSEARWDKFPEGSRLFIGNLSSERVSKKEVFDIFGHYGDLAQISLKQAYGFVQYHTAAEGQAALNNLQGIEIKGRKVHLEVSRPQKRDGDGDKQRGNKRDRRDSERHDGGRGKRDDYRPSRQLSPRRSGHRQQNSYGSDRCHHDGSNGRRGRSRSPSQYGRRDSGRYRQRSPSPSPHQVYPFEAELDIPRRYGPSVPDVQFLLLHEVSREFVSWVEGAFVAAGLRVEVMFLNPRFPRQAVVQRQVVEGVHAVTELTFHTQQTSKIPLQVFDRSAGRDKVRFDQYQDLDPSIAAQLVVRAKGESQAAPSYTSHSTYNNPPAYGSYPAYPPAYSQPAQSPHMPPPYHNQQYPPANVAAGSMDNNTLHQILGSIHNQHSTSGYGIPSRPDGPADMNSFMTNYGANPGARPPPHGVNHGTNAAPSGSGESAQHVQNIMAQLSRYRQ